MMLLLGCSPLLGDEFVVPGELPTERIDVDFQSIAVRGDRVEVSDAPFLWFDGEGLLEGRSDGLYGPDGRQEAVAAVIWAGGGGDWLAATEEGVLASDGVLYAFAARALACDGERRLALVCAEDCQVLDLDSGDLLGSGGVGGQITLFEGVAWWTDPMLGVDGGTGVARSEDGDERLGMAGDHLRRLGHGWVAGAFNQSIVPNRGRVLSLDDDTVLAVERGATSRPLYVAADGPRVAIGVPQRSMLLNVELP